jgi:aspartate aminotransferase
VPNDIPELHALADKQETENGATADDIFVTNGAMHALYVAFGALLDSGDEVIIPDPMWTEVAENIRLAGGVPVGVPLSAEHGFAYRAEDIAPMITSRTKAIFLNTPHNPTGAVLSRAALEVASYQSRGATIFDRLRRGVRGSRLRALLAPVRRRRGRRLGRTSD